jgi:hypothetical protein
MIPIFIMCSSYVQSVNLAVTALSWNQDESSSRPDALDAVLVGPCRPGYAQELPTETECEEMAVAVEVAEAHVLGAAVATARLWELHPARAEVADIAMALRIAVRGLDRIRESWS